MSDTGRIQEPVGLRTRRQIYGEPSPAEIAGELTRTTLIDLAHVVMPEIAEISGIERAWAMPGTRSVTITAEVGDHVRRTGSFTDRIGSVVTTGRSGREAAERADAALGRLGVRLTGRGAGS